MAVNLSSYLLFRVCFGETPGGIDFKYSCPGFSKNITQPFKDFLRLCFSAFVIFASKTSN